MSLSFAFYDSLAKKIPFLTLLCLMLLGHGQALRAQSPARNDQGSTEDWIFLDNGSVRLGVIRSSGAGIGWFSESGKSNIVNHLDRGRLIQQSYYGEPDGSLWNKKPWSWNPVQGGDWRGTGASVLELKSTTNSLYAKSIARHWASGEELTNVIFEEWISLTGKVARIRFKMNYSGLAAHPMRDHEAPAFFVEPEFSKLLLYSGDKPWKNDKLSESIPGWPNESRVSTENWAAYVNPEGYGIGAYFPKSNRLTCYRFGNDNRQKGSCSYFAPLTKFAITPGLSFDYDLYLTIGTGEEIRSAFSALASKASLP